MSECRLNVSWRTQNEFFELCAAHVKKAIVHKVNTAYYYEILVDGKPDDSNTEHILHYTLYREDKLMGDY